MFDLHSIIRWPLYILAFIRAILLIVVLGLYVLLMLLFWPFGKDEIAYTYWWRKLYCKTALIILGLRVKIHGDIPQMEGAYLTVSNHHSFIDPVVTLAFLKGIPVAKAEVSSYPLLHFGAKKTGIIYVDRATPQSRKAARTAIQDGLKEGKSVLVYPEGTISHSPTKLRSFKKGGFYAAQAAGVPVIAVAVQYHSQYAFWQNDRGMLQQYFLQFASLYQKADMYISSPFPTEQAEEVVSKSHTFIGQRLT